MQQTYSVLITRPLTTAQQTMHQILEKGFIPFVIPFSKIIPIFPIFPKSCCNALLATSENAFLHLKSSCYLQLLDLPVYCVGQKTAKAAFSKGFSVVPVIARNSHALAKCISEKKNMRFLYLAGKQRYQFLEDWLKQKNIFVQTVEIYKTHFLIPSEKQLACLPKPIDRILLYSAMTAQKLSLIKRNIGNKTQILCLSSRIATSLPVELIEKALVSEEPTEKSLLTLLLSL